MIPKNGDRNAIKRRVTNIKNIREWFTVIKSPYGRARHVDCLEPLSEAEIEVVLRVFNNCEAGLDSMIRYCRRFRKAAGEVSAMDVHTAIRLARKDLTISEVMES